MSLFQEISPVLKNLWLSLDIYTVSDVRGPLKVSAESDVLIE